MTDETVVINLGFDDGNVVRRTVAAATGISGGTILKLSDPNTAAAGTAGGDVFGGILAEDKSALDSSTNVGAYTSGVHDIKIGEALNAGRAVAMSGSNILRAAVASDFISGCNVGVLEETATGNEVCRVRLRGY